MTCWRNTCSKTATRLPVYRRLQLLPGNGSSDPPTGGAAKLTSLELTRELLRDMDADDADMVAQQMELIQEGCLSKLLVKRQLQDVSVAKRLAEDILQVAQCRRNGALAESAGLAAQPTQVIARTGAFLRPLPEKPATGGI